MFGFENNFMFIFMGVLWLKLYISYAYIDIESEEKFAIEVINREEIALKEQWAEMADEFWYGYENSKQIDEMENLQTFRNQYGNHWQYYADELRQYPNWPNYENYTASRIARVVTLYNPGYFDSTANEYNELIIKLSDNQKAAILCTSSDDKKCELDAFQIDDLMNTTEDVQQLTELWLEPRIKLGLNELRKDYERVGELWDIAAKEQNFKDAIALKLEVSRLADELYDDSMADHYKSLWKEVKPFYQKLHAVCLHLLQQKYEDECVSQGGLMPAQFVGVFGQKWQKFADTFNFYNKSDVTIVDIPSKMREMKENGERSQKDYAILANELLVSLGLISVPDDFIENSYFEKDEKKQCEGYYLLDFEDGRVRAGMCAELNMDEIGDIYDMVGGAQQILQTADKTMSLHLPATDAWTFALTYFMIANFNSPTYSESIGLLPAPCEQSEETIKYYMMLLVLEYYPLIAHAVVLESYRDDIFSGKINIENANCEWYKRIATVQGLYPPTPMDETAFHPAAKHTLMLDITYVNYMYQPVFGLELFEYLCETCNKCSDGEYLHQCDLTGCEKAGEIISKLMQNGLEFSWQSTYKEVFKSDTAVMTAKAMNRYFKLIEEDLDAYIEENDLSVGWEIDEALLCSVETCKEE